MDRCRCRRPRVPDTIVTGRSHVQQDPDDDRGRRVRRLRTAWRSGRSVAEEPNASNEVRGDRQRGETLTSNDRIRAEAPDDPETRRRSDQLEREIKNSGSRDS